MGLGGSGQVGFIVLHVRTHQLVGQKSRHVAEALRDWLPCAINQVEPFMSSDGTIQRVQSDRLRDLAKPESRGYLLAMALVERRAAIEWAAALAISAAIGVPIALNRHHHASSKVQVQVLGAIVAILGIATILRALIFAVGWLIRRSGRERAS